MKTKLLIIAIIVSSFNCFAQKLDKKKIDLFDSIMTMSFNASQNTTPSISVSIVASNKIVYNNTLGYANVEEQIKATNSTKYYIASITKSFSGVLAAKLHFENKIDLNQPFNTYFSGTFTDENIPKEQITIQSLLTHSSGLKNDALTTRAAFTGYSDKSSMLKCLYSSTTFDKTLSEKYDYDNLGYNIYSLLLEERLNNNWKNMLQEQLFEPLGLKNTTAFVPKDDVNIAKSYMPGENGPELIYLQKDNTTMHSAGGLYSTTEDLGNWMLYNMKTKKGPIDEEIFSYATSALLKVDSVKRSLEPFQINGYGLGWKTGTYKSNCVVYHSGSFAGNLSLISFMPDQEIGIAICLNEGILGIELSKFLLQSFYEIYTDSLNEEDVEKSIVKFTQMSEAFPVRIKGYRASLEQREWQLSLNKEQYLGTYFNEAYGEMNVLNSENKLTIEFGNTKSVLSAYKNIDSGRAEFVPLNGEVIQFNIANENAVSLTYQGEVFDKIN